ncbi:MAG: hypothetical protein U0271_33720 [Polyangiaceae bacterium]
MGYLVVESGFSALNPKVWFDEGKMLARTNLLFQVLSLASWCKHVEVDPKARVVTVRRRFLWLLERTTEVPFAEISHIAYRYGSLATSWDILGRVHDSLESYSIALVLTDGSEVSLFSFRGEGSASTGLSGMLLGDSLIDYQGNQGARSLAYIDALQELTERGLSPHAKPRKYVPPLAR